MKKNSTVVPLPKPTKDVQLWDLNHPVSILRPEVTILKFLIHPTLIKNLPEAGYQPGFRPLHSITTAPSTFINNGFNQKRPPERTGLATLDLSQAFDMVCHRTLLELIHGTTVSDNSTKWIANYLSQLNG